MSRTAIREAVMTKVRDLALTWAGSTLTVVGPNQSFDASKQVDPYLRVTLDYSGGFQADLSATPRHRILGAVGLHALVPENSGSAQADLLLEHFYPEMHCRTIGGVQTFAASFQRPVPVEKGWQAFTVTIPFWYDQPM